MFPLNYLIKIIFSFLGTKRFNSERAGDREVQRTMLELLNQLDGFQPNDDVKVIFNFFIIVFSPFIF